MLKRLLEASRRIKSEETSHNLNHLPQYGPAQAVFASGDVGRGGELRQQRVEHAGGGMEKFLRELEPGSRIAVEATGNWWWFVDLAEKLGHRVAMSDPRKTQAIAGACFNSYCRRVRHKGKTRVAVAHKLVGILYWPISSNRPQLTI